MLKPPQVSTWFLSGYGADPESGQAFVANLLNRHVGFAYKLSRSAVSEQDDESPQDRATQQHSALLQCVFKCNTFNSA